MSKATREYLYGNPDIPNNVLQGIGLDMYENFMSVARMRNSPLAKDDRAFRDLVRKLEDAHNEVQRYLNNKHEGCEW